MKKTIGWLTISLLMAGTSWAQQPQTVEQQAEKEAQAKEDQARGWRHANAKMMYTGWVMMALGGAAMIPAGRTYTVLDDEFCVTEYEVSEGRCSTSRRKMQVLAGVIGTGFVLAKIGGRHVKVAPAVTPVQQSAHVTIGW